MTASPSPARPGTPIRLVFIALTALLIVMGILLAIIAFATIGQAGVRGGLWGLVGAGMAFGAGMVAAEVAKGRWPVRSHTVAGVVAAAGSLLILWSNVGRVTDRMVNNPRRNAMRMELAKLASAQESHLAIVGRYASNVAQIDTSLYTPDPRVIVEIVQATGGGWKAVARDAMQLTTQECTMEVGGGQPRPVVTCR